MMKISTFANKRVAVFGLARSGIVAAQALQASGAEVACWDEGQASRDAALKAGLPLVDLSAADWSHFAALILAPGVPLTHPTPHWTVTKANAAGVPVIGDIELFFRERARIAPSSPVVCITGTNGKSTTTALIAHILKSAGRSVAMGGNIGVGVLGLAPPDAGTIHVLELSSFQIDLTPTLNPSIGILTNITPDHLDRHGTLENYTAIKERLVAAANLAIIGLGDPLTRAAAGRRLLRHGKTIGCLVTDDTTRTPVSAGLPEITTLISSGLELVAASTADAITYGTSSVETVASLAGIGALRGPHNAENAAFAVAAARALGLTNAEIAAGLASFPGLAHRMEVLGHVGKVVVINDSKATNADSAEKALASFDRGIFWIAGGTPKEGGIVPLAPYFNRVAKAYLIGKCAPDFAATLDGKVPYEMCGTLDVAVSSAIRDASAAADTEPVVLLSPACASYDQYKSFEHRGDHFRALVAAQSNFTAHGAEPAQPAKSTTATMTATTAIKSPSLNVMLSAGGTGGHLFPAFALAQELARRSIVVDLITDMRGDRYGHDFPARKVYQVPAATVRGRNPIALASTGFTLARGVTAARGILKSVKPAAIIGFGGYPTVPPMLAAALMKIPSALHEQNAVLGRANKMLAKRVTAVATSFENVAGLEHLKANVRYTGNPVRDIVITAAQKPYVPPAAAGPFNILIFGGSQGARFFSDSVPAALATYKPESRATLRIIQQARDEDVERVRKAYAAAGIIAEVAPFFPNLPELIAQAHLVVGRAGASTTAELTVIGRPSILVPLPHALDNDQLNNARRLQDAKAAVLVEQKDLTEERFAHEIGLLLEAPARLAAMAAAAKSIGKPDAVARLADLVEELARAHSFS